MTSAAAVADLPRDDLPHLVFVGRSNVGKSSLINALVRRTIARTSRTAGKTRLINLYRVAVGGVTATRPTTHGANPAPGRGGRLYLVDLPGYGYARGGTRVAQGFEALTREYFASLAGVPPPGEAGGQMRRPRAAAAILTVDARHPGLAPDVTAVHWLNTGGLPFAVVATKVDQVKRAARRRQHLAAEAALQMPVLPVSAVTGEGLNELWKLIIRLLNP